MWTVWMTPNNFCRLEFDGNIRSRYCGVQFSDHVSRIDLRNWPIDIAWHRMYRVSNNRTRRSSHQIGLPLPTFLSCVLITGCAGRHPTHDALAGKNSCCRQRRQVRHGQPCNAMCKTRHGRARQSVRQCTAGQGDM